VIGGQKTKNLSHNGNNPANHAHNRNNPTNLVHNKLIMISMPIKATIGMMATIKGNAFKSRTLQSKANMRNLSA
jgi:hypothetical protein